MARMWFFRIITAPIWLIFWFSLVSFAILWAVFFMPGIFVFSVGVWGLTGRWDFGWNEHRRIIWDLITMDGLA